MHFQLYAFCNSNINEHHELEKSDISVSWWAEKLWQAWRRVNFG